MFTHFTTVADVATAVTRVLEGSDGTYDAAGIAAAIFDVQDGRHGADLDRADFWEVVARHAID